MIIDKINKKDNLISIITACFNSEKHIINAIDSILSQTYDNIEYIIVDGGSTDKTIELIKSKEHLFKGKLKWISEADNGIYDALNKGVNLSTGDVIGFLHSDDFFSSVNIISEINECFKITNCDGLYGDLQYVDNNLKVIRYWKSEKFKSKLLYKGWMPAHPTLFLKNDIYKSIGEFNIKYEISADYDYILRVFRQNNYVFHYLPKVISIMRLGGASNIRGNLIKKMKEDIQIIKHNKLRPYFIVFLLKNVLKIGQFIKNK
jgi:glycosyltransferase involved in cell wall biosynthesis